jgi:hypothetical protein
MNLDVGGSVQELGEAPYNVLTLVSNSRYDDALKYLQSYIDKKTAYPDFKKKTDRLYTHCEELIHAIQAKKNFPQSGNLAPGKMDELQRKVTENWEDLKITMRRLRTIEKELALADLRSSVWVVKALMIAVIAVMVVFVVSEAYRTMGRPTEGIAEDVQHGLLRWLAEQLE